MSGVGPASPVGGRDVPQAGAAGLPTVSVITVCRNAAGTVEKTIQSVLWQDCPRVEHVVIDGMSTDGTWELVQRCAGPGAVLVHEPDTGLYDAMNKGLRLSTGEIIVFLNADDYFVSPYVLTRVAQAFADRPALDIVYGDYLWDSGTVMRGVVQPDRVDRKYFLIVNPSIMHQAMFCRRRAYAAVGPFDDAHFRVAADKDWNIRAFLVAGLPYLHLPIVVSASAAGGYSTQAGRQLAVEKALIARRYFRRDERLYQWLWIAWHRLGRRLRTRDFSPPRLLGRLVPGRGRKDGP